jgi:hypothetical protein
VLQCTCISTSHVRTEQTKGCAIGDEIKEDLFIHPPWIVLHNFKEMAVMVFVFLPVLRCHCVVWYIWIPSCNAYECMQTISVSRIF